MMETMKELTSKAVVCRTRVPRRLLLGTVRVPLPTVGGVFPSDPLLALKDGEEVCLTRKEGSRELFLQARREGEELKVEVKDTAKKWVLDVGGMEVEVAPLLLDQERMSLRREDEGRWKLLVPRWFRGSVPRVEVREGEGIAHVECTIPLAERELRGGVVLFRDGDVLSFVPSKGTCKVCGKPMVEKSRKAPEGTTVYYKEGLCLSCALEPNEKPCTL